MRIVSFARTILLENLNDLLAIPYNYVCDSSTDSEVPPYLGDNLRTGKPTTDSFP